MRLLALSVVMLCANGPAWADRFCNGASAAAGNQDRTEGLQTLRQQCRPGDTIMLKTGDWAAVATTCDFSKAIVQFDRVTVCVFGGIREWTSNPEIASPPR